jgi:hypothetical protein
MNNEQHDDPSLFPGAPLARSRTTTMQPSNADPFKALPRSAQLACFSRLISYRSATSPLQRTPNPCHPPLPSRSPLLPSSSHLISSHLVSSHLISSHLVSSHLISSRLVSSHLISSRLISSHLHRFATPPLHPTPALHPSAPSPPLRSAAPPATLAAAPRLPVCTCRGRLARRNPRRLWAARSRSCLVWELSSVI